MSASPEIIELARAFRTQLESRLHTPVEVVLIGSHARGEAEETSDIDLIAFVPELDRNTWRLLLDTAWEIGFKAGKVLSVIPVAAAEKDILAASPLLQVAQAEGISV